MRIFLDTADINQIREVASLGVISGVTTNPTLMYRAGVKDYKKLVQDILSVIACPISLEVTSNEYDTMIKQAEEMSSLSDYVVAKIPLTTIGLRAIKTLSSERINVNATLCFSVNQAMLARLAGASYVSPFVGRLDDMGQDGIKLVEDIVGSFRNYYDKKCKIIVASIRHPEHCIRAAKIGADIITVPYDILMKMINHPLTEIGVNNFLADWKKLEP